TQEGHAKHRAKLSDLRVLLPFIQWIAPGIIDSHRAAHRRNAAAQLARTRRDLRSALYFQIGGTDAVARHETVDPIIETKDHRLSGAAQPRRSSNNSVQHRLKLEFRATNGAQHLCQCRLLPSRFIQRFRARRRFADPSLYFCSVAPLGRGRLASRFEFFEVSAHHTWFWQAVTRSAFTLTNRDG